MLNYNTIDWDKLYMATGELVFTARVVDINHIFENTGDVSTVFTTDLAIVSQGIAYNKFILSMFVSDTGSGHSPALKMHDIVTITINRDRQESILSVQDYRGDATLCPSCHTPLVLTQDTIYLGRCPCKSCTGTMSHHLDEFVTHTGIFRLQEHRYIFHMLRTRGAILNPVQLFYLSVSDVLFPDVTVEHAQSFINEIHSIRSGYYENRVSTVLKALGLCHLNDGFYNAIEEYFTKHGYGLIQLKDLTNPSYLEYVFPLETRGDSQRQYMMCWFEYMSHPANRDMYNLLIDILAT